MPLHPRRRISLLHARGMPWARIGEWVGQRNLAVTANTYTHVLADETELDYAELLSTLRIGAACGGSLTPAAKATRLGVSRQPA